MVGLSSCQYVVGIGSALNGRVDPTKYSELTGASDAFLRDIYAGSGLLATDQDWRWERTVYGFSYLIHGGVLTGNVADLQLVGTP